jgi:nitrate/nitrite transporter NarK
MTASAIALRLRAPRLAMTALWAFATVAVALGAARAVTTTYVPVLLERIADRPGLIGVVMLVNAVAGFVVPLAAGLWSDRRGTRAPSSWAERSSPRAGWSRSRSAAPAPTSSSRWRRRPSTSA